MNAVKNLALILVVAGVGYLVYQHLYHPPQPSSPETASNPTVPKVEIPGLDRPGSASNSKTELGSPSSSPKKTGPSDPSRFMPASRTVPTSQLPDPDRVSQPGSAASSSRGSEFPERAAPGADNPGTSGNLSAKGGKPASAGTLQAGGASADSTRSRPPASDQASPSEANASGSRPTRSRPDDEIGEQFLKCMQAAQEVLRQGQWTEVLMQLSPWYQHPELTKAESRKLTELLDQLAGSVIYSREHRLEPPYQVRPGDNLIQIARAYQVSWELLAKINGIRDPHRLDGIEQVKVLRGPFHALVDVAQREITLMLEFRDEEGQTHPLYAGRFPIRAITGVSDLQGQYEVLRKSPGPRGQQPGPLTVELSQQVLIHGPTSSDSPPKTRGTIELSDVDMDDVYDILTIGSRVLIRR